MIYTQLLKCSYTLCSSLSNTVSLSQEFTIPFDFQIHIVCLLFQYFHNSFLTPFQDIAVIITILMWSQYDVEADSPFKLLSSPILDKYKEFEHIDMLSIGKSSSLLTQLYHPMWLRIGGSGSLVE